MNKIDIFVIGDSYTGVSSLVDRFVYDEFDSRKNQTIGWEFRHKIDKINNIRYRLWSVSGIFCILSKKCIDECIEKYDFFLIVFDVSDRNSLKKIEQYHNTYLSVASKKTKLYLIGNKCDKLREVSVEEGEDIANKLEAKYYEVSAKTNMNIYNLFEDIRIDYDTKTNSPKCSSWFSCCFSR
jgi:small GTP-binding protein